MRTFRSSLGSEAVREALLVRVESDEGVGWGECVAGSDPHYSPEYIDSAWLTLRRYLGPRLLGETRLGAGDVRSLLASFKGHRMAKAALEMGVLDAELRAAGVSLGTFLGGVSTSVTPGVAVGIMGSVGQLLECVGEYVDAGYKRVKLKIEPGWDIEPVAAVRERFGPRLMLQVDANGSYGRDDFAHLAQLDAGRITTPVCLDESIVSAQSAAVAIALGSCSVVNIKAGRVGGYLEAKAVHDLCLSKTVPVWCGGMLETGIGRAANLALASLPGFSLPGDISASDRYFREDITPPFVLRNGTIAVPTGPGLGVEVLAEVLEDLTTQTETISTAES